MMFAQWNIIIESQNQTFKFELNVKDEIYYMMWSNKYGFQQSSYWTRDSWTTAASILWSEKQIKSCSIICNINNKYKIYNRKISKQLSR